MHVKYVIAHSNLPTAANARVEMQQQIPNYGRLQSIKKRNSVCVWNMQQPAGIPALKTHIIASTAADYWH